MKRRATLTPPLGHQAHRTIKAEPEVGHCPRVTSARANTPSGVSGGNEPLSAPVDVKADPDGTVNVTRGGPLQPAVPLPWTTPVSAPPVRPRTPRKASQKAQCLVAKYFNENGLLDSQATDSQAIAQLMGLADFMGIPVPGDSPMSLANENPSPAHSSASTEGPMSQLMDLELVEAVVDGRVSAMWALENRVEDGPPPAILLSILEAESKSPPLVANLLPRFQEVAPMHEENPFSMPPSAPPQAQPHDCECRMCERTRTVPAMLDGGPAETPVAAVPDAGPAIATPVPLIVPTPVVGPAVPSALSSAPATQQGVASSSQSKGKAPIRPQLPVTTPPRPSVRQTPASAPNAREPFRLAGFEKNIVLQYRQEQATRDQILMEMVNDAVKGEKEKELELKILRKRNEKLEKMVNGGQ